jgi:ABC-2 type transport system ATP-binding protein
MIVPTPLLELRRLNKVYPDGTHAVIDLDYSLAAGTITALLGPNGAGKSTTIGMICGLCIPTGGEILFDGDPVDGRSNRFRSLIGVVSQHANLELDLSGRQNLKIHGLLYGLCGREMNDLIDRLLEAAGLTDAQHRSVRSYSGGMKRKLQIIRALMHDPSLLILDEPTVGLDPAAREMIWDMITSLNQNGKTILFSTHYMEEAGRYARLVSIMHRGVFIRQGVPDELISTLGEWCRVSYGGEGKDIHFFETRDEAVACAKEPGRELVIRKTTLEDVFIELTGRGLS